MSTNSNFRKSANVIMAMHDGDTGQLSFVATDVIDGEGNEAQPTTITINTKRYERAAAGGGKYIDDDETLEKALKILEEQFGITSVEQFEQAEGQEVTDFYDYDGNGSFTEHVSFEKFDKVDGAADYEELLAKRLSKEEFVTSIVRDNPSNNPQYASNFVFGVEVELSSGVKNIKVSQITYIGDDGKSKTESLKYTPRSVKENRNRIKEYSDKNNGELNDKFKVLAGVTETQEQAARSRKIQTLSKILGHDFQEILDSGKKLRVTLSPQEMTTQDGTTYYLAAHVIDVIDGESAE